MTIELSRETQQVLTGSLQRYFKENMEEEIGNLTAGALLNFILAEVGPLVYNKAVADVQQRLQARIMEIDLEVYETEFEYWGKKDRPKKGK